jgi:hypothetical protein
MNIPFGEAVDVDASSDRPRWISAVDEDLHVHAPRPSAGVAGGHEERFVLFKDHEPTLITGPVRITEPSGRASSVRVLSRRPAGGRVP